MSYKATTPFNVNHTACTTVSILCIPANTSSQTYTPQVVREMTISTNTADNITLKLTRTATGCTSFTWGPYFFAASGGLERVFGEYSPYVVPPGFKLTATFGNANTNCTISGSASAGT